MGETTKETYPDGRIIVRDEEGKIVSHKLPPAVASKMGQRSAQKKADVGDDVEGLLDELGLPDDSISARLLAGQFARGGAAAVSAAKELFRLAGRGSGSSAGVTADQVKFCMMGLAIVTVGIFTLNWATWTAKAASF